MSKIFIPFERANTMTYPLTLNTKYEMWVSGMITRFFSYFFATSGLGYAYATNKRMIDKMLKQRIFVNTRAD